LQWRRPGIKIKRPVSIFKWQQSHREDGFEPYQTISRRNLFRFGAPPASQIKLSAITTDVGKKRHAWLSFAKTGETRILVEGDAILVDGSHVRIQEVSAETVQVQIDGHSRKVPIGSTLE
jgi:hypothetical protein